MLYVGRTRFKDQYTRTGSMVKMVNIDLKILKKIFQLKKIIEI